MRNLWDYLFEDEDSGEEFFVECVTKDEAIAIARDNFAAPKYICRYTQAEAEWYGLDTY